MQLPGMGNYDLEYERTPHPDENKPVPVYYKDGNIYIDAAFFEEIAVQSKHRVSLIVSSFQRTGKYYVFTTPRYIRLQGHLPLPKYDDLIANPTDVIPGF